MAKTIVVVDDDEFISFLYKESLERLGYEVIIARDGIEALAKIKQTRPDLILLDLVMPRMDGFKLLKTIKSDLAFAGIPVAVLSNLSQADDEREARALGANDYIVKANLPPRELIRRIQKLLKDSDHSDQGEKYERP